MSVALISLRRRRKSLIRWPLELGATGTSLLVWAGGEYLRVRRKPETPVEREAHRVLNRIDRTARQVLSRPDALGAADRVSDALAYAAVPISCGVALFCLDRSDKRLVSDALHVTRAVMLTGAVNQVIKWFAPRERPFALGEAAVPGRDRYGSFFSNHTSAVTAMAAATTRLAVRRKASVWFGVPLFALALTVGYLRIAADQHYLTDVLAGAAFGSSFGYFAVRA